jgi:DNA polymerase
MSGFFSKKETQSLKRPDGKTLSCHSCGLYKKVLSPRMQPYGNFKKGILNIGEAPGETEDRRGKQWQGKAGKVLKNKYAKLGIDLFDDCLNINAVNCRPTKDGGNRTPTQYEIDCCRSSILSIIHQYKPKVIVLFGNVPLISIIGNRWKGSLDGINKWRGFTIPDQELKAWICPTLHPSYIMRSDNNKGIETIWEMDLKRAIEMVNVPFPEYIEPEIVILEDLELLNTIPNLSTIAIDFETTGLKPHAKGHRIVSASVAVNENKAYSFLMPKKAALRKPFVNLMRNKYIKKIAQNLKYEHAWCKHILKTTIQNWHWDTMLASHVLNNHTGVTGLKFQAYVNFGIIDYNSTVNKHLIAKESNDLNKVVQYIKTPKGEQELLKYNALDSIYTYRLYLKQKQTGLL